MSEVDTSKFSTLMTEKYPDYKWEAINVLSDSEFTADTGKYELTTYKVWTESRDENLGFVFFQHGGSMTGQ